MPGLVGPGSVYQGKEIIFIRCCIALRGRVLFCLQWRGAIKVRKNNKMKKQKCKHNWRIVGNFSDCDRYYCTKCLAKAEIYGNSKREIIITNAIHKD